MAIIDGYVMGDGGYYKTIDMSGPYAIASDGKATLITGGGGSGTMDVNVTNATLSVTGPATDQDLLNRLGASTAAAWGGTGGTSVLGALKALYTQNTTIIGLLNDIKNKG